MNSWTELLITDERNSWSINVVRSIFWVAPNFQMLGMNDFLGNINHFAWEGEVRLIIVVNLMLNKQPHGLGYRLLCKLRVVLLWELMSELGLLIWICTCQCGGLVSTGIKSWKSRNVNNFQLSTIMLHFCEDLVVVIITSILVSSSPAKDGKPWSISQRIFHQVLKGLRGLPNDKVN